MQRHANPDKAPADQQFLDTMTTHHAQGIKMAELVESRAAHDELKSFAKKMIDEQRQDINQMQEVRQKLFADQGSAANMQMPGMRGAMKGRQTSMQKLENSKGETFDKMFLDMMTRHHQQAIKISSAMMPKFTHQEVKDMAEKMKASQQEDMKKMEAWKKQWKVTQK
ncbi:uncharacterized protein (DUF305 family) [Paucimonas lemoignei]|uniref:Uncharacterized protein (DUF305 family) n=2 Tax=Paucimonas lemoignei TaxID=29443 RepID=A0A4R3HU47_PAULE|nr:uncharacterized protein (DUF305 family) [Paucimonas lemoignei]